MMPFSNKGPEPEQASKQRWQSIHTSCRYLFKLTEPILTRRTILKTLAFAIVIGGLMLSNAYSNVSVSDATKDLVDAVTRRYPLNLRLIYLTNAVEWVCIYALGTATFIYLRGRLAIYLRRHLTEKFVRVYFSNGAYYKLVELVHIKKLDNPDQRMQGDADSFSNSLPGITISFMDAAIQIGFWSHKLWYISVTLTCYVFAYAFAGAFVVLLLGKALVALSNRLVQSDSGDLRKELGLVGAEAHSIAINRAEAFVRQRVQRKAQVVMQTLVDISKKNRNITMFTTLFNGLVPLIAPWYIGDLYVQGAIVDIGTITQGGMAVVGLVGGFVSIMNQTQGFASFFVVTFRLGSLLEFIESCGAEKLPADKCIMVREATSGESNIVAFKNVTVLSEDLKEESVRGLTFAMKPGDTLAIIGPDGAGKTPLLMVLAGMSNAGRGEVIRPPLEQLMFLTQEPYLPDGTSLRQILSRAGGNAADEEIRTALHLVNLERLEQTCGGFDSEQNWSEVLDGLAEQQRLSLARIFIAKPKCIVVDEATSALDAETERLVHGCLMAMGATVIWAANNDRIVQPHSWIMLLPGDGSYKILRFNEYQSMKTSA